MKQNEGEKKSREKGTNFPTGNRKLGNGKSPINFTIKDALDRALQLGTVEKRGTDPLGDAAEESTQ